MMMMMMIIIIHLVSLLVPNWGMQRSYKLEVMVMQLESTKGVSCIATH